MNKIILSGRLVRDPEVRITPSEKTVCTFTLAVERMFKNADGKHDADFINIVVWGKIAENSGNYLMKGSKALVEGRLQLRSYEAKDGSGRRYVTEVIAATVEFLERAKNKEQESSDYGDVKYEEQYNEGKQKKETEIEEFDEEIPF